MAELLISALLTIAMSGSVVWLGMRYIAQSRFALPDTVVAAVLPVAMVVPLEVAAAFSCQAISSSCMASRQSS